MSYAPKWRLARWYPEPYAVEVEGEPGLIEIDDDEFNSSDVNECLWADACDALTDVGVIAIGEDEDCRYPEDAYQSLPWQHWRLAPWHIKAAILARRVEALEAEREKWMARALRTRCERQDGDPTVEELRRVVYGDWADAPIARALLRAWGEEA